MGQEHSHLYHDCPGTVCLNGPSCRNGSNCTLCHHVAHSTDLKQAAPRPHVCPGRPCRFGASCRNGNACTFCHDPSHSTNTNSRAPAAAVPAHPTKTVSAPSHPPSHAPPRPASRPQHPPSHPQHAAKGHTAAAATTAVVPAPARPHPRGPAASDPNLKLLASAVASGSVMAAPGAPRTTLVLEARTAVERPANMLMGFVCDVSGSMSGAKLDKALAGMAKVKELAGPHDRLALLSFNDDVKVHHGFKLTPHVDWERNEQALRQRVRGLTAMNDALKQAVDTLPHDACYRDHQKVLVLVTDGGDNSSRTTAAQLRELVARPGHSNFTLLVVGVDLDEATQGALTRLCAPQHCFLELCTSATLAHAFHRVHTKVVEVRRVAVDGLNREVVDAGFDLLTARGRAGVAAQGTRLMARAGGL